MLSRFDKLVGELLRGKIARNSFEPWEVELLLDIQGCELTPKRRVETLRQYQRAVRRQMERGESLLKLSDYLQGSRTTRRPSSL